MDASEHLPGCDLKHTPRQRCSTWVPRNEAVGTETWRPVDNARPDTLMRWVFYTGLPIWIIGGIFLAMIVVWIALILLGLTSVDS